LAADYGVKSCRIFAIQRDTQCLFGGGAEPTGAEPTGWTRIFVGQATWPDILKVSRPD
jgi:hypothetical protein